MDKQKAEMKDQVSGSDAKSRDAQHEISQGNEQYEGTSMMVPHLSRGVKANAGTAR